MKAEQLNQYYDPEGREVVQVFEAVSQPTDLRLLAPFSNETRHSGFLQDLINTFPTPAMHTHRPPTHAMLKESTVHLSRASCCQQGRRNDYIAKKIVPAIHHWKRTRETQDTSVQTFLKVVHKRTYVLVLFSLASEHSPLYLRKVARSQEKLKNIAFVRDLEHFDNEIDFSGLK